MTGIPDGRPEHRGDGDGWLVCAQGHRHWGLFGAAGLLLSRPAASDREAREVLLQHRATWSHHGGTWGLLGGARQSAEPAVAAALREAAEEGGLAPATVTPYGTFVDDHGGWSYVTVRAETARSPAAEARSPESIDVARLPRDEVDTRPLHPGFAASWPALRPQVGRLTVVVDAANVVGSRPDGWWRDRVGAAQRLIDACAVLARTGVEGIDVPLDLARPLERIWPRVVVVLEGAARPAAADPPEGVRLVTAPASGDDAIVATAEEAADDGAVLVVTADRELRARLGVAGALTTGPRWLTGLLDRAAGGAT